MSADQRKRQAAAELERCGRAVAERAEELADLVAMTASIGGGQELRPSHADPVRAAIARWDEALAEARHVGVLP